MFTKSWGIKEYNIHNIRNKFLSKGFTKKNNVPQI